MEKEKEEKGRVEKAERVAKTAKARIAIADLKDESATRAVAVKAARARVGVKARVPRAAVAAMKAAVAVTRATDHLENDLFLDDLFLAARRDDVVVKKRPYFL